VKGAGLASHGRRLLLAQDCGLLVAAIAVAAMAHSWVGLEPWSPFQLAWATDTTGAGLMPASVAADRQPWPFRGGDSVGGRARTPLPAGRSNRNEKRVSSRGG
jgi:hypothetical protein